MRPIFLAIIALLLVTGCAAPATPPPAEAAPAPTSTRTRTPLAPAFTPSVTLPPTMTFTPTPVPHFMSIEALRAREYPGSEIIIERELRRGESYSRYYAYYLSDELKIYALLTVPDGEMPEGGWPAIVFNHGYIPPEIYVTTERYVNYVDRLARAGYIVFRIDYRGHDQSEGEATGAYGDPGYLADVLNAAASLKQFPQANPEKIGMWGHSMGGYLTLRAMVISPDIKAGVVWAGVVAPYVDLLYNWSRSGSFSASPSSRGVGWRTEWVEEFGSPEENPAFWDSVSANSYLADLSGPIQLHHGTDDEDVPLKFSEDLAIHLNTLGMPYEFYIYEEDDHNLTKYFTTAMDRTVAFFDAWLK
ncbi:MAG: hypothetical protein HFACDABA_01234 [Anaerolineales bacterium]|nr:hypothetical protein [Anaerolineales bacterium]